MAHTSFEQHQQDAAGHAADRAVIDAAARAAGKHTGSDLQRPSGAAPSTETSGARPVVRYNPDAPSEEWGWHGSWRVFAPKGSRILLWAGVALLVLSIFSIHVSRVEDYWVGGTAFVGAIWLVHREISGRKMRRQHQAQQEAAEQDR